VQGQMVRNERGRIRVSGFAVRLEPSVPPEQRERMARCLEIFEDFCIISQSLRQGIDVQVVVDPTTP
jgi:organic hydroperoxide reductase OsmC/OhrA